MAIRVKTYEVVLKTANGKKQATAIVAFECEDGTCKGKIISINAKTPNATIGIPWLIGIGTSVEISMSAGSAVGACKNGKCVYTISASWTIRVKFSFGILWYDKTKTYAGTGTLVSDCVCENR